MYLKTINGVKYSVWDMFNGDKVAKRINDNAYWVYEKEDGIQTFLIATYADGRANMQEAIKELYNIKCKDVWELFMYGEKVTKVNKRFISELKKKCKIDGYIYFEFCEYYGDYCLFMDKKVSQVETEAEERIVDDYECSRSGHE